MGERLRWGILGCASIAASALIPAIKESSLSEVVAVASRDRAKAGAFAERFAIPGAYGSYEELLADPEVDAVYIPLPNHLHMEWAMRAAEAGKHVLCEKPLALTEAEAYEMVDACRSAGVQLAEAFMYRHHPRYDRLRAMLAAGEIGTIRAVHSTFRFNASDRADDVRFHREMGGGSLLDNGCYCINVARYVLDAEPEAVTASAFFSPRHDDVDMMASGLVEFAGGTCLTFECGMWAHFRQGLEIIGTHGRIDVPAPFMCKTADEAAFTVTVGNESRVERFDPVNQYTVQVDDFARAVVHGARLKVEPEEAVRNMRVLEASLRSARERARIALT